MDLVFGAGSDYSRDDALLVREDDEEVADLRRLMLLLSLKGMGLSCVRHALPRAGEIDGLEPIAPNSRERYQGMTNPQITRFL